MRFAILIPMYNSALTIGPTLVALQQQCFSQQALVDVYLADDCSQDQSVRIAKEAWNCSAPLHILHNERNLGERGNVNNAFARLGLETDWVLLLHADDLVKPGWLAAMRGRAQECNPAVASICSSWDTLCPDGSVVPGQDEPWRPVESILGTPSAVRNTVLRGCWWHISGCAIRCSAFRAIGGFAPDMPQLGDLDWLLRCLQSGWSVEYIPRTLLVYRQHSESVSSVSFRRDRDIHEKLRICLRYVDLLSTADVSRLHAQMSSWMIRRSGRALLARSWRRLRLAIHTQRRILGSWFNCSGAKQGIKDAKALKPDPSRRWLNSAFIER
jgi:glycosyltransferase involved in cell wall biosynthesis